MFGPEESFRRIREALIADPTCAFRGDPDYAVRDPALVDPVIQRVLDRSFRGQLPTDERGVQSVARRARGTYANLIDQEEVRAYIEARVLERYQRPRLSWEGGLLVADHGIAPGPLERQGRAGWSIQRSEVIADGEWRGELAAASLAGLAAANPEARALSARIQIPTGTLVTQFDYRWIPSQDRLILTRDTASTFAWVISGVGGDLGPWVRGERPLRAAAMTRTSLTRKIMGWDPDAPL